MIEFIPAVDAHHHLWDSVRHSYPYLTDGSRDRMHGKPLPRVYSIEDYSRDISGLNITKSVHIQCGWNPADPAWWLNLKAHPEATDDIDAIGDADAVFIGVKAYSLPELAPRIGQALKPGAAVIAAQNGIPWWYFQSQPGPLEGKVLESVDPADSQRC